LQEQIGEGRQKRLTYRHERQVKAEAEALIIVERCRHGSFALDDKTFSDAFFVSNTGVLDRLGSRGWPITMRPGAVLQWLSTLSAASPSELSGLTSGLLWEISERGVSIVDTRRLHAIFGPLLVAAKRRLSEEVERNHEFMPQIYGEENTQAFVSGRDIDAPIVLSGFESQRSEKLERELAVEREAKQRPATHARVSEKERAELEFLRAKEKQREQKAARTKRAAASAKRKRRR